MKLNNKGVSLVELVVTIAILGVITVGVQSFTLTSAKVNANVTTNVKQQYESQLVMANVQKRLVNATDTVCASRDRLIVTSGNYVSAFFREGGPDVFYYGTGEWIDNKAKFNSYKLSENITGFNVSFVTETPESNIAIQADINITFEKNGKVYTGTQSVTLRNKPIIKSYISSMTSDLTIEVES